MPNTKSAARRVRNSARKQLQNRSLSSRLKSLERQYHDAMKTGKKDDVAKAFKAVSSAFDKAAKSGVVHRSNANRKKSRLAMRMNSLA